MPCVGRINPRLVWSADFDAAQLMLKSHFGFRYAIVDWLVAGSFGKRRPDAISRISYAGSENWLPRSMVGNTLKVIAIIFAMPN